MLLMLILLMYLSYDQINFGKIKNFTIIIIFSRVALPEPETDLSIIVNLSNNSIFILSLCYEDAGKEAQCACVR